MADLTTVSDFPPWSINYKFTRSNAVTRTQQRGFKRQASYSHRQSVIAKVTRQLTGIELPYFESFVRNQASDGADKFTDKYKDGGGVQSGTIQILNGRYKVTTNGKNHIVECDIEIFR